MKNKDFDCVEMKNRIQAELLREYEGLTDEQIQERRRQRIESDPILGPFMRRVGAKGRERETASKR